MTASLRPTKRKLQFRRLLEKLDPSGIALLNELRAGGLLDTAWGNERLSFDDHKKSFIGTFLEHGEPFTMARIERVSLPYGLSSKLFFVLSLVNRHQKDTPTPPAKSMR